MNQNINNSNPNNFISELEANNSNIEMQNDQLSMSDYPGLSVAITADVC